MDSGLGEVTIQAEESHAAQFGQDTQWAESVGEEVQGIAFVTGG